MQSKPTTVLLATIAALLAANLFVTLPPQETQAAPPWLPRPVDDAPRLVGITVTVAGGGTKYVLRLWSDGVVEHRIASNNSNGSGPLNWDPGAAQFAGWTEIVPLP